MKINRMSLLMSGIVIAILILFSTLSTAQDKPWQIIRRSSDTLNVARIDSISHGILYAKLDSSSEVIAIDSATSLIRLRESYFWRDAFIGSLGGSLVGGIIAAANYEPPTYGGLGSSFNFSLPAEGGAVIGAALGFIVGGLVDVISIKTERYDIIGKNDEAIRLIISSEQNTSVSDTSSVIAPDSFAGGNGVTSTDSATQKHPIITIAAGARLWPEYSASMEVYLSPARMGSFSIIVGAGYFPESSNRPAANSYFGRLRYYANDCTHGWFYEMSVSVLALSSYRETVSGGIYDPLYFELEPPRYGPSVEIGYCIINGSGLTFNVAAGCGFAQGNKNPLPVLLLNVGYTIR